MAKLILISFLFLMVGGVAYLAFSDVPAPTKAVEKPITSDRFFK